MHFNTTREEHGNRGAELGAANPRLGKGDPTRSPSTLHADAELDLLLGVWVAWCHVLPLSIRSWAPNWTQMLKGQQVGLPLQRDLVRLSL